MSANNKSPSIEIAIPEAFLKKEPLDRPFKNKPSPHPITIDTTTTSISAFPSL
jgi:hypothetical protein